MFCSEELFIMKTRFMKTEPHNHGALLMRTEDCLMHIVEYCFHQWTFCMQFDVDSSLCVFFYLHYVFYDNK